MINKIVDDKTRVMVINAPNPKNVHAAGNYAVFPAMGVVSLGTRLRKENPLADVRVSDGGIKTTEGICAEMDKYRPDVVALSVLSPTYEEGLKLAKHAKHKHGALTILGNDHASFFPRLILEKRPYVDVVVMSEFGEEPLSYVVAHGTKMDGEVASSEGKEGIYFRRSGAVHRISLPKRRLFEVYNEEADIPDLGLIKDEFSTITRNYNELYGQYHTSERKPVVINNVRGCGNGQLRCTYCSIYDLSLNAGKPEFFWQTVKRYNKEHGINFFFEVCDSFLTFQKYIKELIETMPFNPKKNDMEFEVYARANDVVNVSESISWLKKLNITRVNLGLDSGDDNMLGFLRKNNSDKKKILSPSQINYEALRRLAEAGITFHVSFPLGSLGETHVSLKNTLSFIGRISRDFGYAISTLEASELVPLPYSPCWDLILMKEHPVFSFMGGMQKILDKAGVKISEDAKLKLRSRHEHQDLLDVEQLAKDWVKYFTHIGWEEIEEAKRQVEQWARKIGAAYGGFS